MVRLPQVQTLKGFHLRSLCLSFVFFTCQPKGLHVRSHIKEI